MKNRIHSLHYIFLMAFMGMGMFHATAQEAVPITLEKVLEWGGANNLTIKEYKERQALSLAQHAKAKEWWLPKLYAGAQTQQLWGAAMNADGRFFLDVERQNLWGGVGLNAQWDFAQGIYEAKARQLNNQASVFLMQAERNQKLLQIIQVYYQLMTAQLLYTAYQNLVNQSDSMVQQIQVQVDGGLRYESEILLAKSNKNHLSIEMLNAQKDYNAASAELKKLLNIEQHVKLVSTDNTLLPLEFTKNIEPSNDSIYLNRPEVKANKLALRALKYQQKKHTAGLLLPTLNLATYGSYFGRISGQVAPMFPDQYPTTQQLYPTGALNVSLLWKIPLGELTYQGDKKIYSSRMRLKEIKAQQFKVQINKETSRITSDLKAGKEQIEIAKEALDFTTKALKQSIERQKIGTVKPFEVFQSQQFYLQAQIDYLKAVSAYNQAQYALKVARGENL